MGEQNWPNYWCPEAPVYSEPYFFPDKEQCEIDTDAFCAYLETYDPWELPCLDHTGKCYYEALWHCCSYAPGFLVFFCFYRLNGMDCVNRRAAASNENDMPRVIQYDYLNLYDDTVLFDIYPTEDNDISVLSLRSRPHSINVKVKFDWGEMYHGWG